MATIPSPKNWASGDEVTASQFNTDIRDGFGFLKHRPMALVYDSAGETVTFSASAPYGAVVYSWDTLEFDNDGIWSSGANTRLTCRTTGIYEITSHVEWTGYSNANAGNRYLFVTKNNAGSNTLGTSADIALDQQYVKISDSSYPQSTHVCMLASLTSGDYIETVIVNTKTTALTTIAGYSNHFSMCFVGSS